MDNRDNIAAADQADAAAAKMNDLLKKVVMTPEGSTAIFTGCYCTDRAHLDAMKSDPESTLMSIIGEKCESPEMLDKIQQRINGSEINLLQNEPNHWHIVLPPRGGDLIDLPEEYLEQINGGELLFFMGSGAAALAITTTVAGTAALMTGGMVASFGIVSAVAGIGAVALIAGGVALAGAAVGVGVAVGALAITGNI